MIKEKTYNNLKIKLTDYSVLKDIREFVSLKLIDVEISEVEKQKIVLAIDEICTNLIKHALGLTKNTKKHQISSNYLVDDLETGNSIIDLSIEVLFDVIKIEIIDKTSPFNLLDLPDTNMNNYFKLFKSGGLGVKLVKLIMDDIQYLPANNEHKYNTLILTKKIQ